MPTLLPPSSKLPDWISHPPSLCYLHLLSLLPQSRHRCLLTIPQHTLSPPSVRWARHGSASLHRHQGWRIPRLRLQPPAESWTPPQPSDPVAPPRLSAPSSPPSPVVPPAPPWSVVIPPSPQDSAPPASPRRSIPLAPLSSSLPPAPPQSSVAPAPPRTSGAPPRSPEPVVARASLLLLPAHNA
ncbi:Leucine-rich repeat-containing protein 37A [Labeo rohita]|uniref:Leucine-rich repeat-containing protein 37A n=1 Tax=Labeo rohita TaxID=84645 RepID=A0ABQ8MHM9_LABRO|nr:Leucine-rich repeat-containing protein 37A [Labeo rohita]